MKQQCFEIFADSYISHLNSTIESILATDKSPLPHLKILVKYYFKFHFQLLPYCVSSWVKQYELPLDPIWLSFFFRGI